ncbi:unnamed protein product [Caenorhabditis angaria]|uniref:Uncharacterized protein n=1 Tax=Caenorhabditis angaria TaxID=860376 RepID=A0A9P1I9S6_9PELO|nr:unnamed protein product [Caenorhabditis angaria]
MLFGKRNILGNLFNDVQCTPQHQQQKRQSIFRKFSMLSSRRSIDSLSSTLSSPRTPSPRGTFSATNSCELTIVAALQGHILTVDEMRFCALEIGNLSDAEKLKLLTFLKSESSAIIENNALKSFQCASLNSLLLENLEILDGLWEIIVDVVIPNLQSIIYTLSEVDASFDVQKWIFTAFRDRVLAKLLQDVQSEIPKLKSMLTVIMVETDDNLNPTTRSKFDICLGKSRKTKKPLEKTRSKTDSCLASTSSSPTKSKSVTWSTFSS